jgi:hypothetical protein
MVTTAEHVAALREVGYSILPALYSPEFVQLCQAELERLYEAVGRPKLCCEGQQNLPLFNGVVSGAGLAFARFLSHAPALQGDFVHPEVLAIARGALGEDMRIEMTSAAISDHTRVMHRWHQHLDAFDEGIPGCEQHRLVDPKAIGRLTFLFYLDEIGPRTGPLVVYPRKLDDPVECPFQNADRELWDGHVAITCPPGSAVVIEARTWHGALPRELPGLRRFAGACFGHG